jgi:hypothetical protein
MDCFDFFFVSDVSVNLIRSLKARSSNMVRMGRAGPAVGPPPSGGGSASAAERPRVLSRAPKGSSLQCVFTTRAIEGVAWRSASRSHLSAIRSED